MPCTTTTTFSLLTSTNLSWRLLTCETAQGTKKTWKIHPCSSTITLYIYTRTNATTRSHTKSHNCWLRRDASQLRQPSQAYIHRRRYTINGPDAKHISKTGRVPVFYWHWENTKSPARFNSVESQPIVPSDVEGITMLFAAQLIVSNPGAVPRDSTKYQNSFQHFAIWLHYFAQSLQIPEMRSGWGLQGYETSLNMSCTIASWQIVHIHICHHWSAAGNIPKIAPMSIYTLVTRSIIPNFRRRLWTPKTGVHSVKQKFWTVIH